MEKITYPTFFFHNVYSMHSDFVTISYGEAWESSCEKSWVLLQN